MTYRIADIAAGVPGFQSPGIAACIKTHVSGAEDPFDDGDKWAAPAAGTVYRWRGEWKPGGLFREDVDERQHFTEGIQALFGRLSIIEFSTEAPGGGRRKFPAYTMHVPGVSSDKPVPILGPGSEAADPRGDSAPYGILRIRHTESEPTTLGGTRWVAHGQVVVSLYRRPAAPGRTDAERIEREQQVAKDLDSTATVIVNLLSGGTEREIPDIASGVPNFDSGGIAVCTETHESQAETVEDDQGMWIDRDKWAAATPAALVRWRDAWEADTEYSADDLPLVPSDVTKQFRNRLPNGFRADLSSANAEELGSDEGTYRMRVVAPFTYYGPQGANRN